VGDYVKQIAPEIWESYRMPAWPPDAFAIAASLLQKSGAYTYAISSWPPKEYARSPNRWVSDIRQLGKQWREAASSNQDLPSALARWWKIIRDRDGLPVYLLRDDPDLSAALLELCAAADEASVGAGIPGDISGKTGEDPFGNEAKNLLAPRLKKGSTLCRYIPGSKLRVLPKLHTPQSGITMRSLTHNLALCPAEDVEALWYILPTQPEFRVLNLLLIPWPEIVTPSCFRPLEQARCDLLNMPGDYGFFTYSPARPPLEIGKQVMSIFERAAELSGQIDGVVLPELALTGSQRQELRTKIMERDAFLISGINEPPSRGDRCGKNYLAFDVPINPPEFVSELIQDKHHRWLLDKRQIVQYSLADQLDPGRFWWEHIGIGHRSLAFVALRPWLTVCTLICEDLARQDPIAELLRAVGPNLVVALLMDGPQLGSRWPARYATVLAEDPGSSVLTLTSIGMSLLSRPPDFPEPSRVIALWKDALGGRPVEISMPPEAEAMVLTLTVKYKEEWTADGRSDGGVSGYPVLSDTKPVLRKR